MHMQVRIARGKSDDPASAGNGRNKGNSHRISEAEPFIMVNFQGSGLGRGMVSHRICQQEFQIRVTMQLDG